MLSVLDCWRRLEGSTPASHSVTVPTRKCVSGSDNPFPSSNLHYITFVLWLGAHTSAPTSEPDVTAIKSQSASLARLRRVLVTARALVLHGSPVKHRYSSSFSAFTLQNMRTGAARFASPTHTTTYTTTLPEAAPAAALFLWTYRNMWLLLIAGRLPSQQGGRVQSSVIRVLT